MPSNPPCAVVVDLAELERDRGNWEQAAPLFLEALGLGRDLGFGEVVASCLEGLASLEFMQRRAERAAQLYGAAQALRDAMGSPMHASAIDEYEQHVDGVRNTLGGESFTLAWNQGQQLSLEQAIAYARATEVRISTMDQPATALTPREREIAMLLAQGLSNRQIATRFTIAVRTVDTHVSNILNKLGLTSRKQIKDYSFPKARLRT